MKNLKASLPATMAGIASKAGLRLKFGQPRTDGKTVWVSDIPLNPSKDDYNTVVSDLIHEIGHIRYTDFSLDRHQHQLMPMLTNVFEDVRIERELQAEFLGARTFLNEGYKVVVDNGTSMKPDNPANALGLWLISHYMVSINGRSALEGSRDMGLKAIKDFGASQDLIDQIRALCDHKVPQLASTQDVIDLSKEVIDLLEQNQQQDEQDQQSQQDSQDSSGDDSQDDADASDGDDESADSSGSDGDESGNESGDEDSDSQQESNSGSGDSDDDSSQEDGNESGSSSSESDDSGQDGSQSSSSAQSSDGDQGDSAPSGAGDILNSQAEETPISLREAAQSVSDNINYENSLLSCSGTEDFVEVLNFTESHRYHAPDLVSPDMSAYSAIKSRQTQEIQALKNKVARLWQNESRTRSRVNEFDGRFSCSDAIRCRISGESNYLVKKSKRQNHKPAVCVLADLSSSMNDRANDGERLIVHQAKALIALSEACDLAKIPLSIIGFSGPFVSIKKWNDSMAKARPMIGGTLSSGGGTDLPGAVFQGVNALSSRKEKKKILITMTDGEIFNPDAVKNVMAYARTKTPNMDFYGLGIGVGIEHIFDKGGEVDPTKLAESILDILSL